MRGLTILLALWAIGGFAANAFAEGKIRLAQVGQTPITPQTSTVTSAVTTCMMTCNSTYANCQSSCIATGTQARTAATQLAVRNPSATCISSCTNQELQCQVTCAGASPSR